ncbi:MAG: M56 family metallopeptidase [Acidimicrobiales bacterium]
MTLPLLAPAIVAVMLGVASGVLPWSVRPRLAVPILSFVIVAAASTALMVLLAASAGFVLEQPLWSSSVGWCPVLSADHTVGWRIGLPALTVLVWMTARARRILAEWRLPDPSTDGRRFLLLATDEPIAYASPGQPGCVVVSSGMLAALGDRERTVLFAHERAHLDQHHHRHLFAAGLCAALIPALRPLADKLRLATEMSADESAASAVDGDRRMVAQAITRAALAKFDHPTPETSFTGGPVARRIDALVGDPAPASALSAGAVLSTIIMIGASAASSIQFHNLVAVANHVCGR